MLSGMLRGLTVTLQNEVLLVKVRIVTHQFKTFSRTIELSTSVYVKVRRQHRVLAASTPLPFSSPLHPPKKTNSVSQVAMCSMQVTAYAKVVSSHLVVGPCTNPNPPPPPARRVLSTTLIWIFHTSSHLALICSGICLQNVAGRTLFTATTPPPPPTPPPDKTI